MLKNLQLLRAFAALSVVIHHYNFLNFRPGAFGVDIFFVISGFIISFTLEKNKDHFFLKRVLRVAPMYYLATLLVTVIWFLHAGIFKTTHVDIPAVAKSMLFVPYSGGPVLGLGYTLNYEMYFYLSVTLFLLLTNSARQALVCTSFFIVILAIINRIFFGQYVALNFYGNNIVFEFVYGIILYFIYKNVKGNYFPKRWLYYGFVVCILSLLFLIYIGYFEIAAHFRGFLFGIPAFIICLFFVFSDGRFKTTSVAYQYFYKLGNASYTMYLIHPFVIFGVLRLIHPLFNSKNILLITIEFIISVAFVCTVSIFVYNKVELPIQRFFKNKFLHAQNEKAIN